MKDILKLFISILAIAAGIWCSENELFAPSFVFFIIGIIFYRSATKEDRRKEKEKRKREGKSVSFWDILLMIVFLPIALPVKLIMYIFKNDSKYESSAAKYLRETDEYYAKQAAMRHAKKAKEEQLLRQAELLEDQAKYQSGYKYKQTMKEAENLRREAGRL